MNREAIRRAQTLAQALRSARPGKEELTEPELRQESAATRGSTFALQLPSRNISTWTPADVQCVIESVNNGTLTNAADFTQEVMRDDRVRGVLSTRTLGMLGLPLGWEGEEPENWTELAPEAELNKLLTWGLALGVGLAYVRPNGTLQAWNPRWLRRDTSTLEWWVTTSQGERKIVPGEGWVIFAPYGSHEPWNDGLWTALAIPWLVKRFGIHDRARASEVFGSAMVVGKADPGASEGQRTKWLNELRSLSRSSRLVLPDGYDLSLLEAQGQTWGIYSTSIDWADAAMTITIAGQIVTTEGQTGFSRGDIHQAVAYSLIRFGAETFSSCLARQYIAPTWRIRAWPRWNVEPPTAALERANSLQAFGSAVQSANSALGVYEIRVAAIEMASQNGIKIEAIPPDESAGGVRVDLAPTDKARILTVNEARASMGFPPLMLPSGAPNPLGDKLIADLQTIAPTPEDEAKAEAAEAPPPEPTATTIAASRSFGVVWRCNGSDVSQAPTEFRIFKFGRNDSDHGSFNFTPLAARAIVKRHSELMIDLEHLSLKTESKAYNPDAMGWASLEIRRDGLWAVNVRWTDEGRDRIESRKQKYISPAFKVKAGKVIELLNVALTALPAMHDIAPLIAASKGAGMDPKLVKEALDALVAGDSEKCAELLKGLIAAAAGGGEAPPEEPAAEEMNDAPEEDDEEEPVAASISKAIKEAMGPLVKRMHQLSTRVEGDRKATLLASRQLNPGERKWLASQPLDIVESYCSAIPAAAEVTEPVRTGSVNARPDGLTPEDLELCSKLGMDPDKLVEQRKLEADAKAKGYTAPLTNKVIAFATRR